MRKISIILLSSILWSCSSNEPCLSDFEWIIGKRSLKQGRKEIFEEWTKINAKRFLGKSYYLNGSDTIIMETIELVAKGEEVHLIPKVKGQNNNAPVVFKLVSFHPDSLVFVNPNHDFPSKIGYIRDGDHISAWIEGYEDGELKTIPFYYSKVKQ